MMEQAYEIPEDTKEQYLTQYEQINHFFRELQSFQYETSPCISGQTISRRIQTEDICFYKIIKLSYDEDCPQREAFENVLLLLDDSNYNFVYILSGEQSDVSLYIGVVNNSTNRNASNASDYGRMLQDAMEGNFSGSKLEKLRVHSWNNSLEHATTLQVLSSVSPHETKQTEPMTSRELTASSTAWLV